MEIESISKNSDANKRTKCKNYTFKLEKKFIRIEYPGLIKNIDKAMDTLGGINGIELVRRS